jgi:hypothetical protein
LKVAGVGRVEKEDLKEEYELGEIRIDSIDNDGENSILFIKIFRFAHFDVFEMDFV